MKMLYKQLIIVALLFPVGIQAQVSKTNNTMACVNNSTADRIVNFTAGDFGGCTTIADVDITIHYRVTDNSGGNPGAFGVHEDLDFKLISPTGTVVPLVQHNRSAPMGCGVLMACGAGGTCEASFVGSFTYIDGTVTLDQSAAAGPINRWNGGACATSEAPTSGTYQPHEGRTLDSFNGENPVGNWTLRITDPFDNFGEWNCLMSYTLTITCAAACSDPDIPTLTATPSTICPGSNSTLTISGNLNDATQWHVYTGSCGGTQIGTTASTTFVVSPATTTTYYIRGEGGCVTPGSCGSVTVTAQDITNPTITCPGNQTGTVDASCSFSLPDYTGLATASDNCTGSPTITQSPAPGTNVSVGTTVITLTATDGSSNTASCNFNVVVSDVTNPTISCPGDQNQAVDAACNFILADYTGLATASDNCGVPTVTQSPAPGSTISGATVVTLTATDGSSNTASCTFNVIGLDGTLPTIICPGNQTGTADASCNFSLPDYTTLATANDNCPGVTVTQSPAPGTNVGIGTTTITLTATDVSSNTASCTFDLVVSDNTPPTITCPGNQTESPNAACQFTLPDYTGLVTASDNCTASPVVTQSPTAGTVISGTTTITMTVSDGASNTASCTFDVILSDATPPTAVCQNIDVFLDVTGNATITAADIDGGSSDNCAGLSLSASQTSFTCANLGANNVTLTATDGNANSSSCTAIVTVIDNTSPTVTCPGNQTEVASGNCDLTLPDYTGLVTATDNCTASLVVTQSPAAGTVITSNTTITMTADDGNGNTTSCTFEVVLDMSTCAGAECTNALAVSLNECGDMTTVTGSTVGGTPTGEGTCITTEGTGGAIWYTFTGDGGNWTATTDNAGTNYDTKLWVFEGTCGSLTCVTGNDDFSGLLSQVDFATTDGIQYYIVVGGYGSDEGNYEMTIMNADGIAPEVPILLDLSDECSVTVTAPTTIDNCAGTVTGTTTDPLTYSTEGVYSITWNFDDGNGNMSSTTQNVIIEDATAPIEDVASLADITSECEVTPDAPTATDNCVGSITGTPDVTFPIVSSGTTVVTWTYDDGNGNVTTQTQNVIITPIDVSTTTNVIIDNNYEISANAMGYTYQWIENCGSSNDEILGETNQQFVPTANGIYAVILSNGVCSDTSNCVIIDDLGMDKKADFLTLNLYPNPTTGEIIIDLGQEFESCGLYLIDAIGEVIDFKAYNNNSIIEYSINESKGIYFLKIVTEKGSVIQRIVKQ